jgi:hypothetical protein
MKKFLPTAAILLLLQCPALGAKHDQTNGPDYFRVSSSPYISRWSLARMPLRMYIEPTSQVVNFTPEFAQAISRAMDLWCEASEGKLSWTAWPDDITADIIVRFSADLDEVCLSPEHRELGVCEPSVKRLRADARIGGLTRANIRVLTTTADGKPILPAQMQDIAAHEIGHALGLRHSPNQDDVMYYMATKKTKDGLTDRDKATIRAVYGAQVYDDGTIVLDGVKVKH